MHTIIRFALILTLVPSVALAGTPDGLEILKKMQETVNGFADTEMEIELTVKDNRGKEKSYGFNVKQRGEQRLIVFGTGESKGQAVLIQDTARMYIYLPPPMNKVQSVAVGNMRQSFLGSDWSNTDMSIVDWSEFYDVAFESEDEEFWYITLTPKKGQDTGYAKVIHKIGKNDPRLYGTKYYNAKGEHIKTFWVKDVREFSPGLKWPHAVGMTDPRTGHESVMNIKDFKVNQGFKKSMFTPRYLKWLK
jgi:outer membrane lipoprotein-sorting protein